MIQKVKDGTWRDESGAEVPIEYVSAVSRLKERSAATLVREAKMISQRLAKFKKLVDKLSSDIFTMAMRDYEVKAKGKGNFTWYNFDRSIKVEVSISERIEFDGLAIQASKEKLDAFLSENLDSKTEFLKQLVIDAFSTSGGKIDTKKVFQLMKYRSKIKDQLFQEAINILEAGITKPDSKTYFRIWERDKSGEYKLVDLNFSSI
jgi:hypothetical protein